MKSLAKNITLLLSASLVLSSTYAMADEGGASFWLPGQSGSFSAVQSEPGWSMVSIYYHNSSDAQKDRTFPVGDHLTVGLDVSQDLSPTYTDLCIY